MNKKLPVFDVVLDPNSDMGVNMIALVDDPAIGVNWIALQNENVYNIFLANTDLQELWGPILIPNKLIYRTNLGGYPECYIRFSKEQIRIIADKFNEDLNQTNIKFTHNGSLIDGYLSSNWVIDDKIKLNLDKFNLEDGTWFGIVKVKNTEFWLSEVKTGKLNGFSVEIEANIIESSLKLSKDSLSDEIKVNMTIKILQDLCKDFSIDEKINMTIKILQELK